MDGVLSFSLDLQPDIVWADGSGDAPCTHNSIKYWKAPHFLSWLYNESPVRMSTLANSRWAVKPSAVFVINH